MMTRLPLASLAVILAMLASCSATTKLDRYPIHGTSASLNVSIEPLHESEPEDYGSVCMNVTVAVLSALLTHRPEPLMHDESLATSFQDGFESELDSVLNINTDDTSGSPDVKMIVRIRDCKLESTMNSCSVRFSEDLTILVARTNQPVYSDKMDLVVPLHYCGSIEDSISMPSYPVTEWQYKRLRESEQLSALQCAAYEAGMVLADSLASISKQHATKR
ncbi:MAG: hypothetical protein Q8922_02295 [Bacteroidota bacterium]|nr:hypothetical protein [Bacteroidota bacterium]